MQPHRPAAFEEIRLEPIQRTRHQVVLRYSLDGFAFTTTYWYSDVDLDDLENRLGAAFMEKLLFHQAAFEANKLVSLGPKRFDLGPYRHLHTDAFSELWSTVVRHVWAEWRYRHDDPHYEPPEIVGARAREVAPVRVPAKDVELLMFCGGGKDSLVMGKLLDSIDVPYASQAYAHSTYGRFQRQHDLIDRLLDHLRPVRRHRMWCIDDFLDCPILELHPESNRQSITAAETPASIFAALPILLAHGYRMMGLGHEASANFGNLRWAATGEEVNHQWGKSLAAERLLDEYLKRELLENAGIVGVLQPLSDPTIFHLLNRDLDAVRATHSCNVDKPWCKRCPKCAYVWLGYLAFLPEPVADEIFGENLFEVDTNRQFFRQMLGLEDHTPFECIGRISEARFAFELCRRKGRTHPDLEREVPPFDPTHLDHCFSLGENRLPHDLSSRLLPQMARAIEDAQAAARRLIDG